MIKTINKFKCPDAKCYPNIDYCTLTGKVCLLELGTTCPYYDEYLKEEVKDG